jgi:hypothetical protein
VVVANTSVGWNRRRIHQGDAFAFAEKWEKNQRYESEALQDDGNCYCTLLEVARALFGLRIAFDQTTAE